MDIPIISFLFPNYLLNIFWWFDQDFQGIHHLWNSVKCISLFTHFMKHVYFLTHNIGNGKVAY